MGTKPGDILTGNTLPGEALPGTAVIVALRLSALFLLFALCSCGDMDAGLDRRNRVIDLPMPVEDKIAYADSFPLLDYRTGAETRPVGPTGTSPFGALLVFFSETKLGLCSASHLRSGRVLTNAHCIDDDNRRADYYVVFYDKNGAHSFAPIQGFGYVGNKDHQDVAILNLGPEDAARWDTVDSPIISTAPYINRGLGQGTFPSTIWSFDPLHSHPTLDSLYPGREGAVFRPKNCDGFRSPPKIDMITSSLSVLSYPPTPVNVQMHLLFDNCDTDPIQGNSGSLITRRQDLTQIYGVFHWIVGLWESDFIDQFHHFEYTGSSGIKAEKNATDPVTFYFVGSDLESVHQAHPDAW